MTDISIVIAGAAGQGVQTVEQLLVGIFKMSGFHVFATKEYESRVRGGSNSTELRISEKRVAAFVNRIDLLIPFSLDAIEHVKPRLSKATTIIADKHLLNSDFSPSSGSRTIFLPFQEKAIEIGNKIYTNVIAVGAIVGLFSVEASIGEKFLQQKFGDKGAQMVKENIQAFMAGVALGKELQTQHQLHFSITRSEGVDNEILFNGNQAVALGAIAGGCNFISAYPMSPSTGVLIFLAQHSEEFEIVVDQAEDEIAAINKTVAAWYAGARAIASTSGGGFALMSEGLSLAGIMESPLVIHIAQRPGPATGLPTRTAQEDLNLAVYSGHGEFCRMVFAPGTIEQAFYLTQQAFNLADELQIPIFILTDQDFVDAYYNIPRLDVTQIKNQHHFVTSTAEYQRYKFTETGISPRSVPGYGEGLVRADSDEHDENGHITENMEEIRPAMVEKRIFKRQQLVATHNQPPSLYPTPTAKIFVLCWGSNYHVVKEAVDMINNPAISMMHFHQVYPIHADVEPQLNAAEKVIILENNATGQFANLLKLHANFDIPSEQRFLRYSGKPWSVEEVLTILEKEVI